MKAAGLRGDKLPRLSCTPPGSQHCFSRRLWQLCSRSLRPVKKSTWGQQLPWHSGEAAAQGPGDKKPKRTRLTSGCLTEAGDAGHYQRYGARPKEKGPGAAHPALLWASASIPILRRLWEAERASPPAAQEGLSSDQAVCSSGGKQKIKGMRHATKA